MFLIVIHTSVLELSNENEIVATIVDKKTDKKIVLKMVG